MPETEIDELPATDGETIPAEFEKPESVGADEIFDAAGLGEMPKVQPHAIEAYKKENDLPGDLSDYELDPKTGKPLLNSKGKPKKRRGRKPKTKNGIVIPPERPKAESQAEAPEPAGPEVSPSRPAAIIVTNGVDLAIATLLRSPEMRATEAEKDDLILTWEKYLESKGVTDVPPGVALVIGIGIIYGAKLIQHEEPRKKTVRILDKLKFALWSGWQRMKRRSRKANPENERHASQSDLREE